MERDVGVVVSLVSELASRVADEELRWERNNLGYLCGLLGWSGSFQRDLFVRAVPCGLTTLRVCVCRGRVVGRG